MTCDEILDLVSFGESGIERRPEFIDHLKLCVRCRDEAPEMLAAIRLIRAAPSAAIAGHPASEEIATLALDPEAAALDINRRVAEHLSGCASCAAEMEEVRQAEQARLLSQRRVRSGLGAALSRLGSVLADVEVPRIVRKVALATGLGLLVAAYPAYLALHHFTRVKGQFEALELRTEQLEAEIRDLSTSLSQARQTVTRLSTWTGPLHWYALASPVRGQSAERTLKINPDEPYAFISVRLILAGPVADPDVYRFVILSSGGQAAWTSELTVAEIRGHMKSAGALIFPIPSALLVPGKYELRVVPNKGPQEPILQIPFEIISTE